MFTWNLLGILLWVAVIMYLVFIIQHIRHMRIKMIVQKHKRFDLQTFLISLIEVAVFVVGFGYMFNVTILDNPDLEDTSRISSHVVYKQLIPETSTSGKSTYVKINSSKRRIGSQTYTVLVNGHKITVASSSTAIVYGSNPIGVDAERIPYNEKQLRKQDKKYQKAYVAIYTARYKANWQNGIGMHAGRLTTTYYLIRVPDSSFVRAAKDK